MLTARGPGAKIASIGSYMARDTRPRRARPSFLEPMEIDMPDRRLTRGSVCVLAAFPLLLGACAGHTAPPASNGDIDNSDAGSSAIAQLTKSDVVPANIRALPNRLLVGVKIDQPLTTARPEGFAFSTKVAEAIKAKDGGVAIPEGTTIRGVITAVRPAAGTTTPVICLNLDFLELAGRSYGIVSTVKNVLINDKQATILPHDSLATLFTNEGFPVKGTAIALPPAAPGEPAELPAGTVFVVQLDSALTVIR